MDTPAAPAGPAGLPPVGTLPPVGAPAPVGTVPPVSAVPAPGPVAVGSGRTAPGTPPSLSVEPTPDAGSDADVGSLSADAARSGPGAPVPRGESTGDAPASGGAGGGAEVHGRDPFLRASVHASAWRVVRDPAHSGARAGATIPACFLEVRSQAGFTLAFTTAPGLPPARWQGSGPVLAGMPRVVAGGAEIGWDESPGGMAMLWTLVDARGLLLARVIRDRQGVARLAAAPSVRCRYWVAVLRSPRDGVFAGQAREGRLGWAEGAVPALPPGWVRDPLWLGGAGDRLSIPLAPPKAGPPQAPLVVGLHDSLTPWTLLRDLRLVVLGP